MARKRQPMKPMRYSEFRTAEWLTFAMIKKHYGLWRSTVMNRREDLQIWKPGRDYLVSRESIEAIWGNPKTPI